MCGSSPEPDVVTRSTRDRLARILGLQLLYIRFDAVNQFLVRGPKFEPEEAPAS